MAIDFGALVSRTFQILLRYKVLWVLGVIVTLLSTNLNFSYNANSFNRFSTASEQDVAALAGGAGLLACVAFILYVVFFFVRAGFEAGLIIAGDRAAQDRPPTLQEAWALGRTRMWPIIGLNLIIVAIGLVVALIFVILALVILGSAVAGIFSSIASPTGQPADPSTIFPALGGFIVCFCGFLLLAIPLFAVLGVVIQLAQRAAVLDNQGVGQAWSTGWQLFRANIGNVLMLLLIEFGIGILVAIVIGVISAAVSLPLTALALNSGGGAGGTLLGIVIGVILWVVTGVLGALPLAGNSVLWTLFYRILTVPAGAGPGQAALYPAGPPPGAYGAPPASPYGTPGGYSQPGQPPGGYTQPGQYPGGYTQPGQYPGGYSQPPGGYTQPGQYPGGYVPPSGAAGGYGAPAPPAPGYGPPPAPPANPYGPPAGQGGYGPPSGGEDRARTERDTGQPGDQGTGQ